MEVLAPLAVRAEPGDFEVSADLGLVELVGHQFRPELRLTVGETAIATELTDAGLFEILADFGLIFFGELELGQGGLGRFFFGAGLGPG